MASFFKADTSSIPKQFELVEASVSEINSNHTSKLLYDEESFANPISSTKNSVSLSNVSTREIKRVDKEELEYTYLYDEIVFSSINKYVQVMMSGRHFLDAKDKKNVEVLSKFLENLETAGDLIDWEELKELIIKSCLVYGWQPLEQVRDEQGKIISYKYIDPKTIDYAKDSQGNILLDSDGEVLGYTQKMPDSVNISNSFKDPIPESIDLPTNSIYLKAERIIIIGLYDIGSKYYPSGIVEPIYNASKRKANMSKALTNAIHRHGFPIIWARIGDQNHQPTRAQIDDMLEKLKKLDYSNEIATPYYYEITMLEGKHVDKLQEYLNYSITQQIAGLGIPKPYALNSGEGSNRSTLDNQSRLFNLVLEDIWKKIANSIRRKIFAPISKQLGLSEVPRLNSEALGVDEIENKSLRLMNYIREGVLSPEQLEEYIKQVEELQNISEKPKDQAVVENESN